VARYRDRLAADAILILDGPAHPSGRPTLYFGARGIVTFTLTVYGPRTAVHSGHYGNWVPNPAMRLAQLLASMKDERGRVVIDGFYDGITEIGPEEQALLDAVPDSPDQLKRTFGIASAENPEWSLQFSLQAPSLNVRGLSSGYVNEPRTIIPDRAQASLDMRLVKETPATQMIEKVRAHLVKQGYYVVPVDPDDQVRARYARIVKLAVDPGAVNAFRTSSLLPVSKRMAEALTRTLGEAPVRVRTLGGTVPITPFIDVLGVPAIGLGIVNFDNNQHTDNENLRLGHLYQGITSLAALLTM
jgi:acetylornithine deacetylase/succinyl-diaminopimelate desuccinylase-like protein